MNLASLQQVGLVVILLALAVFIGFIFLIARFYQLKTGEDSHYRWFAVPLLFFSGAILRYIQIGNVWDDILGDLLWFLGGMAFAWLTFSLYRLMTGGKG
jgi:hypothetical protein